ncbi:MAG: maleylpyruvate isomerase family mycothiol-dependent enzyme [Nakamurella sp.]
MIRSDLPTDQQLAAIAQHSAAFAEVVDGHFDAAVEYCPGWTVADLVAHITEVQWFWATIAEERPTEQPAGDDPRRPAPITDPAAALTRFETGAARLVEVLRAADQSARCWTWTPDQQDIAFITRHQVQEIAVHHWDAARAAAGPAAVAPVIAPDVATDAVTEFLTFSVASDTDPAPDDRESLDGVFRLRATDTDTVWSIHPGQKPATATYEIVAAGEVAEQAEQAEQPEIAATAADLLLWLYGRVVLDTSSVDDVLLGRFRRLCFTD